MNKRLRIRAGHRRILNRFRRLFFALGLITAAMAIGTIGYIIIDNYRFLDAFYMTVITLATVGYREINTPSDAGKIFTILLIISNLGIFAYAISALSSFLLEGNFQQIWRDFIMTNHLGSIKNHIIVCGYGRYGREVSRYFREQNVPFVVIENAEAAILELAEKHKDILYVKGDATREEVLEEAGIHYAQALVTTLPDDAENVYVVLTARQVNPNLRIVSRAVSQRSESKLIKAGANEVINPERIGGFYIATLVNKPDVVEFFNAISNEAQANISFEEIKLIGHHAKAKYTIKDLNIRARTGVNVIGLKTADGHYIVNPPPDMVVLPEMHLILLGEHAQIESFKKYWNIKRGNDLSLSN